jgi:hypothetical protein
MGKRDGKEDDKVAILDEGRGPHAEGVRGRAGALKMRPSIGLLDKYASTFRDLINAKVRSSDESVKSLLRLNKEPDWEFLCAAMDIIGDASTAIDNVVRFGLTGATKYEEIGEQYLRLYGLLSATYIQQESVLTIYRIMNVPDPKKVKERFGALEIRSLRRKLSAHGTGYLNFDTGETESHVPVRVNLGDFDLTYVNNAPTSHQKSVNLSDAIDPHAKLMVDVLDIILEKSINTIFRGNDTKRTEFTERLGDLRVEKSGGYVLKSLLSG